MKNNVFNVRSNTLGHSMEKQWGLKDPYKVQGCLTPLPQIGDFAIDRDNRVYVFIDVKHMGNPKDGYFATMEPTHAVLDENESPTHTEIMEFLTEHDRVPEVVR